jgi:hypothetical protein
VPLVEAVLVKLRPLLFVENYQLVFDRPIFDWTGVMQNFFDLIFKRVGARIPVKVNEFSTYAPGKLSEMNARYNVYGGPSSVSLFPDKLTIDFPHLAPADIPLVGELLKIIHDGFAAEFKQVCYSRVEIQDGAHMEVLPPDSAKDLLGLYQIKSVEETFREAGAVTEAGIKFAAKCASPPWSYSLMAEQSLLNAAAVYTFSTTSLLDAKAVPTFEEKNNLAASIAQLALKSFGAEQVNVTAT